MTFLSPLLLLGLGCSTTGPPATIAAAPVAEGGERALVGEAPGLAEEDPDLVMEVELSTPCLGPCEGAGCADVEPWVTVRLRNQGTAPVLLLPRLDAYVRHGDRLRWSVARTGGAWVDPGDLENLLVLAPADDPWDAAGTSFPLRPVTRLELGSEAPDFGEYSLSVQLVEASNWLVLPLPRWQRVRYASELIAAFPAAAEPNGIRCDRPWPAVPTEEVLRIIAEPGWLPARIWENPVAARVVFWGECEPTPGALPAGPPECGRLELVVLGEEPLLTDRTGLWPVLADVQRLRVVFDRWDCSENLLVPVAPWTTVRLSIRPVGGDRECLVGRSPNNVPAASAWVLPPLLGGTVRESSLRAAPGGARSDLQVDWAAAGLVLFGPLDEQRTDCSGSGPFEVRAELIGWGAGNLWRDAMETDATAAPEERLPDLPEGRWNGTRVFGARAAYGVRLTTDPVEVRLTVPSP